MKLSKVAPVKCIVKIGIVAPTVRQCKSWSCTELLHVDVDFLENFKIHVKRLVYF